MVEIDTINSKQIWNKLVGASGGIEGIINNPNISFAVVVAEKSGSDTVATLGGYQGQYVLVT